ncbi:MAG TPA: aldehyde dehydrogenase family protein [Vicinamibacterales bacterium]|jgi:acyl-CoA reductase-like NAD-dependent aldehyde dehydrogenase|nr:aldehyde dehydrogenase family protein [Vicinamibacterales bacterium]
MTESLIIDGNKAAASDGKTFDVYDPSSGDVLAVVAKATKADVDRAVIAAHDALDSKAWGGAPPAERGRVMIRIAQSLRERAEELATLESRDNGKPLKQARADVQVAARYFEFFAGVADKIMGNTIPLGPGFLDYTVREPIGVSAQIIPWNYPIQIGARGIAPAIAAGCTVVLKPAEDAPMTALRLGEIALECGLPPGVVNVLPGMGPEAGAALASHPGINQLTFTGSVEVGIAVAKMAADNVVPVVMELGGKSPNIVFADADLDTTAAGVANAIFQNAGQTCSAGSRLLVERKAHDAFVARLAERAKQMRVGPGVTDPDMGPIISKKQLETVESYVKIGQKEGALVAAGGSRSTDAALTKGYFFQPTLLDRVSPDMRVAQEEIFGPVLAIITFDDLEEAIAIANRSQYGLVAGIWTRDINKAMAIASRVKTGQVYINTYGAGGGVELPFGGYKKSGYGREKGLDSLASYTQIKNVCVRFA